MLRMENTNKFHIMYNQQRHRFVPKYDILLLFLLKILKRFECQQPRQRPTLRPASLADV